jgi:hypothetical protein
MDDQLALLAMRGVSVTCPDRAIGGWPFRMDIDCSNPTFSEPDRSIAATVKHLRITALIYQPTLVIAELDGPLTATGMGGETVHATWSQLQASLGFSLSPTIRPERLSVVADDFAATVERPDAEEIKLAATHGELHARPAPDASAGSNDVDVAVSMTAATLTNANRAVGPAEADYAVNVVARGLPIAPAAGGATLKDWVDSGGRVDIEGARLSVGGFSIDGKGYLTAGSDGLVNGQLTLVASGIGALMSPAATSIKGRAELLGLATVFTLFGSATTPPPNSIAGAGKSLQLTIDQGRIKMGPTGFGRLPPLF